MRDQDIPVTDQAFAPACAGYVQKAISERASTPPSLVWWNSESARLLPRRPLPAVWRITPSGMPRQVVDLSKRWIGILIWTSASRGGVRFHNFRRQGVRINDHHYGLARWTFRLHQQGAGHDFDICKTRRRQNPLYFSLLHLGRTLLWVQASPLIAAGRRPESYLPSQTAVESEKRVFVTAITSFAQPRLYPSALPLGPKVKGKFDG